jgi:hypothetical protein
MTNGDALSFEERTRAEELGISADEPYLPTVDCPKELRGRDIEAWWRLEWERALFWPTVHGEGPVEDTPPALPLFPVHVLPEQMRRVAETIAANKCVPVDMSAQLLLATVALLAGPRFIIDREKQWLECLTEWTVTIVDSGQRKTPAFEVVEEMIGEVQRFLAAEFAKATTAELDELKNRLKRIGEGDPDVLEGREIGELTSEIQAQIEAIEADPPRPPRLLIGSETTPEALQIALARNDGYIGVFDDEGGAFDSVAGPYNHGVPTGLGTILGTYGGKRIQANERVKRSAEPIPRAIIAYGITCQPDPVIASLGKRSLSDRGFHGRWLFAMPRAVPTVSDPPELDGAAIVAFTETLKRIADNPVINPDAQHDKTQWPTIRLSKGALKLHRELQEEFEPRKSDGGDLVFMATWANKYVGRVLRHAGLLHLAAGHGVDVAVSEDTMRAAIEIGEWALAHAAEVFHRAPKRARGRDGDAMEAAAVGRDRVERWIASTRPTHFTTRDAYQKVRKQTWCRSTSDVESALQDLERDWRVRQVPRQGADGRTLARAPWWVPHPDLTFGKAS